MEKSSHVGIGAFAKRGIEETRHGGNEKSTNPVIEDSTNRGSEGSRTRGIEEWGIEKDGQQITEANCHPEIEESGYPGIQELRNKGSAETGKPENPDIKDSRNFEVEEFRESLYRNLRGHFPNCCMRRFCSTLTHGGGALPGGDARPKSTRKDNSIQ